MAWGIVKLKRNLKNILIGSIVLCFFITIYLGSIGLPNLSRSKVTKHIEIHSVLDDEQNGLDESDGSINQSQHRLAVIIPFRDRFDELLVFGPFIQRFLKRKSILHDIVVVNQVDDHRFNRAALINVGFLYTTEKQSPPCDYFVMHDVDLLPLNNELPYEYPEPSTVTHVAAPGLHPKYNYPTFIGGILVVPSTTFKLVNGMSNVYWGWGLEDDEFYVRLRQNKIQVKRPTGLKTGRSNTFRHTHSPKVRTRDMAKCFDQWNKTRKRDRLTGLNNVNYTLVSISHMMIDEAPIILLNVNLHCDLKISPWCNCNQNKSHNSTKPSLSQNKTGYKHKRRKT